MTGRGGKVLKDPSVLYLWSREACFSWRTVRTLWREGRMSDSYVLRNVSSQWTVQYFLPG